MTFTIFKENIDAIAITVLVTFAVAALVYATASNLNNAAQASAKNRVPTLPTTAVAPTPAPAPPETPKAPQSAPAKPYYGSAFYSNELLTSAYYYPQGGDFQGSPDEAFTHLKFNHREDDIFLCGDQRSKFEPGKQYTLVVTYEVDRDCATNWKLQ